MATLKVTNIKNESFAGDQLYLKTDGKIGIGTASPGHKLVISQTNSGGIAAIHFPVDESTILGPNANTYLKMGGNVVLGANGQLDFTTSGTSKLTIKNNGQVAIGSSNTDTSALISIIKDTTEVLADDEPLYNNASPAFLSIYNSNNTGTGEEAGINLVPAGNANGAISIYGKKTGSYAGDLIFRFRNGASTSAERLRIKSGGQVCVGTTSGPGEIGLYLGDGTNPAGHIYANGTHHLYLLANAYYSGGWKYLGNGEANSLALQNGDFLFNNAPTNSSGAAAAITWSERLRIKSDGRICMGSANVGSGSADDLNIENTSDHGGITIRTPNTKWGSIHFADGGTGDELYRGQVSYDHANDWMRFYAGGSSGGECFRIKGNKDIDVVGGNIAFSVSGKGIDFSATSGTGSSELFDDYEEGTWTPTSEGSSNKSISAINSATYVKIGRLVHCQCYIVLTSTGNSSVFLLGSLPFTNKANGYSTNVTDFGKGGRKGAYARVNSGTTYAEFLYSSEDPANTRVTIKGQDVGNGYLITSITYMTDV